MNKTRKIIAIISGVIIAIAVIVGLLLFLWPKTFSLSTEYYNSDTDLQQISVLQLEDLIAEHKSFAVFVYQPACRTSEEFEKILKDFSTQHNIKFLKTPFADLKTSGLIPDLKYYPSMLLYHDGKLVTFLRADSDEDLKVYQDPNAFADWWKEHVKS